MSTLKDRFDALVLGFKENSKKLKEVSVALAEDVKLETEVQELNVWTMKVINDTFAEGDVIKYLDWEENEQTLGSGEFQIPDGRRAITDATGVIVMIKDAVAPKAVEVPAVEPVEMADELDTDENPIVKPEDMPESIGKDFDDEVKGLSEGEYNYMVTVDAEGVVSFKAVEKPSEEEDKTMLANQVKLAEEARAEEIKLAEDAIKGEYEELLVKLRSEFGKPFVDAPEVVTVKVPMTVTEKQLAEINIKRGK